MVVKHVLTRGRLARAGIGLMLVGLMVPNLWGHAVASVGAAEYEMDSFDISDRNTAELRPRVSGERVVWQDYRDNGGAPIGENANANIYFTDSEEDGDNDNGGGSDDGEKINDGDNNAKRPDIDSDVAVWTEFDGADLNIRGYEIDDDDYFDVATGAGDQDFAAVSGRNVVFQDDSDGDWDIRGYDFRDDDDFNVSTASDDQIHPAIDGDIVVWVHDDGGDTDIRGRNLDSGDTFTVTDTGEAFDPDVDGDRVVYAQGDATDDVHIWMYDISEDEYTRLSSTDRRERSHPRIDGNIVVWQDEREGSDEFDIWGYDLETGEEFLIDSQGDMQTLPAISGDFIVWTDESGNLDVRGGRLNVIESDPTATNTPTQTATAQPTITPGPPAPRDQRFFFQTGYRIDHDTVYDYFLKRGGVDTFGYPISRTFRFLGFTTQFFQRQIVQIGPDGQARLLNLLDPGLMPVDRINNSTFPSYDSGVANASPLPGTPNYDTAIIDFIRSRAPESFNGQPVLFFTTFMNFVTCADAYPFGNCQTNFLPGFNLEMAGSVTSQPMADPANQQFIYLRFQRQILHYSASCQCTQPILLADWFKSVITGNNLPSDLSDQMDDTRFHRQYNNGAPLGMNRPAELPDTNMQNAFEPQ